MSQCERVLNQLERAGEQGITALDFPRGFPLRSRISNLRAKHQKNIISRKDEGMNLHRYWLIRDEVAQ